MMLVPSTIQTPHNGSGNQFLYGLTTELTELLVSTGMKTGELDAAQTK